MHHGNMMVLYYLYIFPGLHKDCILIMLCNVSPSTLNFPYPLLVAGLLLQSILPFISYLSPPISIHPLYSLSSPFETPPASKFASLLVEWLSKLPFKLSVMQFWFATIVWHQDEGGGFTSTYGNSMHIEKSP